MDEERLAAKIESIETSLSLLAQRVEVQAAGEAGYRALALEKLETLKLSVQTSALLQMQEATKHYDQRITNVEFAASQHIKACDEENRKLETNRNRLWIGLLLVIAATVGQYVLKYTDTTEQQIMRRLDQAERLIQKQRGE